MALEFRTIGTDLTPDESGFRFEGYAAVFNTESRGLDFTEVIQPGAFTRSLTAATRGEWEIKAYQDHDPKMFLGSTRTGTLKLTEDKLGLKVDLALNKDVSYARDLAANIRRDGAGAGMSFGFTTPRMGDSWSADGSKRELKSVKLHEVSVIVGGTPAYESTVGLASVRSVARATKLDPDEVRLALSGLISGKLDPERAATVRAMLGALSVAPEPLPEPSDEPESLPLQIRKLQLMLAEFRHPGHGDQSVHAPRKGLMGAMGINQAEAKLDDANKKHRAELAKDDPAGYVVKQDKAVDDRFRADMDKAHNSVNQGNSKKNAVATLTDKKAQLQDEQIKTASEGTGAYPGNHPISLTRLDVLDAKIGLIDAYLADLQP
jgi:HK97 family phage prohead protease